MAFPHAGLKGDNKISHNGPSRDDDIWYWVGRHQVLEIGLCEYRNTDYD